MREETHQPPNDAIAAPLRGRFRVGVWQVEPESGALAGVDAAQTLEPRVMALLQLLAGNAGRVLSRRAIEEAIWAGVIVGEDTVARTVSRLRRALGDSAQTPGYIETLPRRGYRLIAPVEPAADANGASAGSRRIRRGLLMAAALTAITVGAVFAWTSLRSPGAETSAPAGQLSDRARQVKRADDLYMRFTRQDNEAAIGLYERVLAAAPDDASAQAGLANALVQRVVRWQRNGELNGASSLAEALQRGLTKDPQGAAVLGRALAMAERAVRLAPNDPDALKSLAFVQTARGEIDQAADLYQQLLALDGDAWAAHINLSEIESIRGDREAALAHLERAWFAMARAYAYEPQRVGPWQAATGVLIGRAHVELAEADEAELWFRRVLADRPYEPEATVGLAALLAERDALDEANALCAALVERLGPYQGCPPNS